MTWWSYWLSKKSKKKPRRQVNKQFFSHKENELTCKIIKAIFAFRTNHTSRGHPHNLSFILNNIYTNNTSRRALEFFWLDYIFFSIKLDFSELTTSESILWGKNLISSNDICQRDPNLDNYNWVVHVFSKRNKLSAKLGRSYPIRKYISLNVFFVKIK